MADATLLAELERLGFADVILWVISFALIYGLMSQAKIPKDKASRAIIGFVAAFLVLMASPASLITTITNLGTSLLVVLLGIMILLVFIEAGQVKHYQKKTGENEKGEKYTYHEEIRLFHKSPKATAMILILAAVVIFLAAGGLNLANINLPIDPMGGIFLAMVALAILWLVTESK